MKDLTGKGKPFHSALDKAAALLKRKVGTGAEFMQELKGLGGIKQAEIDERKLGELMGMPRMTHDQFMANLAIRPAPAIQEKVLGEPPSKEDIIKSENAMARRSASNYADSAETSREAREMRAEELRRLRAHHRPQMQEAARRDIEGDEAPWHEKYTLPGGENYREMLIKAPSFDKERELNELYTKVNRANPEGDVEGMRQRLTELQNQKAQYPKRFEGVGAHFGGEPDILASLRIKDRIVPDLEGPHSVKVIGGGGTSTVKHPTREAAERFADIKRQGGYRTEITPLNQKKLLHLEELQSDWHQQGREKGYNSQIKEPTPEERKEWRTLDSIDPNQRTQEQYARLNYLDHLMAKEPYGVPDAPFKKNWEEMALKRLVHHAAENGYQGIVVTPGAEQADRYSLAKHLNRVVATKVGDNQYSLTAHDKNGDAVINGQYATKESLPSVVGKELADKIVSSPNDRSDFSGLDLQVGGEGMKAFYDKKVPNILNAIGKKHGVKTELNGHKLKISDDLNFPPNNNNLPQHVPGETRDVHHFPITEDMRKDILTNGLPLYKEGGIIRKAEGGNVQLSVDQMRQQLMSAGRGLPDISQIGAEEAPNMPVKSFVIPQNGAQGSLPMGGVDMSPMQPGQQMLPSNALQPNPLMPQQPQQPQGAPLGGMPPPPAGGSNILQMTPQGQALAAMKPPMQKAEGGEVSNLPPMIKVNATDNGQIDNGALTFNMDNFQELAKGGKVKKPLHYEPSPSLSKADIEAMADRMARQISGLDNPNQKTLQQLAREQNLPIGIKSSKKMDVPIINYEDLKGSYSVGVPGDTSRGGIKPTRGSNMESPKAGEYLTDIGGEKLDYPVGLYGGKDYGAYGHPAGWASDLGASRGMFNVVRRLAKENPELDVYGHYHKMSPEALNHAVHMLEAVLAHHKPHASDAEKIAHLNNLMRNERLTTNKNDVPYPSFAGFENPEDIRLQAPFNSGMRKKIINLLGKEKYFPGGKQKLDDIIYAISHPELRNIETGAGGSAIIKFDPSRSLKESLSPHPTYGHDIPSSLAGRTRYLTPAELLAPRSMANAKREIKAMGKKVVPFNQAKMNIIREPIDEQYINQIGEYELAMKKRLGYKKGGGVNKSKVSDNLDTMRLSLTRNKKAK